MKNYKCYLSFGAPAAPMAVCLTANKRNVSDVFGNSGDGFLGTFSGR